jgi:hypothetical protein
MKLSAWRNRLLVLGLLPLLAVGGFAFKSMGESGFTTLPDGSKIKLLKVTSGKSHQLTLKYFSLANALRSYSPNFGPYVSPDQTEIDTTSSIDCTVFWTKRIPGKSTTRPLSALVMDELGNSDRIQGGPFAFTLLRDRFFPTEDGVVQGWPVPNSSTFGKSLNLQLFERPDTLATTEVRSLISFSTSKDLPTIKSPWKTGQQANTEPAFVLQKLESGIPLPLPPPMFDFGQRGPREAFGSKLYLKVAKEQQTTAPLQVVRMFAKSAAGISYTNYNMAQTTAPGTMQVAFAPGLVDDVWELKLDYERQDPATVRHQYVTVDTTADESDDLYLEEDWSFKTTTFKDSDGGDNTLFTRCGFITGKGLICLIGNSGEQRKPLRITALKNENDAPIAYDVLDAFTVQALVPKRGKLKLEVSDWPSESVTFYARPKVLVPKLVESSQLASAER